MGYFLTDSKCIKQREYVDIPKWHDAGHDGEGIVAFHDDLDDGGHNYACVDIIQTILPKAKVLSGQINHSSKNGVVTECTVHCNETKELMPLEHFIVKYNVSLINNSTSSGNGRNNSPFAVFMRDLIKKYNLIGTGAYGNFGEDSNKFQGAFIMVSGVRNNMTSYGVRGLDCDFSMFMGFQEGTSFAAPFLCGMAGLYKSKYKDITQSEVYALFKSNCEDLGADGKDEVWGWGLPIMIEPNKRMVTLTIGSNVMTVDGQKIFLDTEPVIDSNNRTLVPVRAIAEAFGYKVEWLPKEKEVLIAEV